MRLVSRWACEKIPSPRRLRALEYLLLHLCTLPVEEGGGRRLRSEESVEALLATLSLPEKHPQAGPAARRYQALCQEALAVRDLRTLGESRLLERARALKYELGRLFLDREVVKAALQCLLLIECIMVELGKEEADGYPGRGRPRRLPIEPPHARGAAGAAIPLPPSFPPAGPRAEGRPPRKASQVERGAHAAIATPPIASAAPVSPSAPSRRLEVPSDGSERMPKLATVEMEIPEPVYGRTLAARARVLSEAEPGSPASSGVQVLRLPARLRSGGASRGRDGSTAPRVGREAAGRRSSMLEMRPAARAAEASSHDSSWTLDARFRRAALLSFTAMNALLTLYLGVGLLLQPSMPDVQVSERYVAYELTGELARMPLVSARRYDGLLILTTSGRWLDLPVSARRELVNHLAHHLIGRESIKQIVFLDALGRRLAMAGPRGIEVSDGGR